MYNINSIILGKYDTVYARIAYTRAADNIDRSSTVELAALFHPSQGKEEVRKYCNQKQDYLRGFQWP